jgi:Cu-Zn family superoxide dismutase
MRALMAGIAVVSLVASAEPSVKATLRDIHGQVLGKATLTQVEGGVRIQVTVTGLAPGPHGIHVHAVGLCEGDFASAGGHFNPGAKQHGRDNPMGAHLGDLPNVAVDASGVGKVSFVMQGASFEPGEGSLFPASGTALVLHAAPDDLKSDPAGNSGDRVACGVIERRGGTSK